MNYIGSKHSLLDFIGRSVDGTLAGNDETKNPNQMVFADLFAGTGAVGVYFKQLGYNVISNDIQYYSFVLLKHLIENNNNLDHNRCSSLIDELNNLPGVEGFIYKNYSYEGTKGQEFERMYFTGSNAMKCDAMRMAIEEWLQNGKINPGEYYFLLGSLINSIDKFANTASVYGAFLKSVKKSAAKEFVIEPLKIINSNSTCKVYNEDILGLVKKISGDILYLDPPYNARQYCDNYHILETIARYDNPIINGKTGLRTDKTQKSVFCNRKLVCGAFEELIKNANFKYIFLSYNNEGLMSLDEIENIMKKYGSYSFFTEKYHRFKADCNRTNKYDSTIEYLHCLVKNEAHI